MCTSAPVSPRGTHVTIRPLVNSSLLYHLGYFCCVSSSACRGLRQCFALGCAALVDDVGFAFDCSWMIFLAKLVASFRGPLWLTLLWTSSFPALLAALSQLRRPDCMAQLCLSTLRVVGCLHLVRSARAWLFVCCQPCALFAACTWTFCECGSRIVRGSL